MLSADEARAFALGRVSALTLAKDHVPPAATAKIVALHLRGLLVGVFDRAASHAIATGESLEAARAIGLLAVAFAGQSSVHEVLEGALAAATSDAEARHEDARLLRVVPEEQTT